MVSVNEPGVWITKIIIIAGVKWSLAKWLLSKERKETRISVETELSYCP